MKTAMWMLVATQRRRLRYLDGAGPDRMRSMIDDVRLENERTATPPRCVADRRE
jgi:hypothetical protein